MNALTSKRASELERHYQNVLFIVFKLVGFYTQAEYHTSEGRIDLVVKTTDYIYVMEFKLEGTAEEAIAQIEEKHYTAELQAMGYEQIECYGIAFYRKNCKVAGSDR